jgi:hypothetical protein
MLTVRYAVDFSYTRQDLDALIRCAGAHDVEQGGRHDARSAAINVWLHHWIHPATREESEMIGTFYVHWAPPSRLYEIETDEGFDPRGPPAGARPVGARRLGQCQTGGGAAMSAGAHEQLLAAICTRLTRLVWLWALGEVWFTLLMAGAVVRLLWARARRRR